MWAVDTGQTGPSMGETLHAGETAIDEVTVRTLLAQQCPDLAEHPLRRLPGSGTDNVLWRIHRSPRPDLVVRLPRTESASTSLGSELLVLDRLAGRSFPVAVPAVEHVGRPGRGFPHRWAVLGWMDGVDAWAGRASLEDPTTDEAMGLALAEVVATVRSFGDLGAPKRRPGGRGGPLPLLLDGLDRCLDDPRWSAESHVDVAAVRRLAAAARELPAPPGPLAVVHGDLLPGNLLVRGGRLAAVIDWGSAAMADPAQDLTPAWAVLGHRGRVAFREALDVDDATWLRGRAFELEHAVTAVVYYRPRRHLLAEIMSRTLERVLADG